MNLIPINMIMIMILGVCNMRSESGVGEGSSRCEKMQTTIYKICLERKGKKKLEKTVKFDPSQMSERSVIFEPVKHGQRRKQKLDFKHMNFQYGLCT